jgi:H+/Cl- antiporter ClcA
MRHARRFIAILVGCATWCIVSTTVAFAAMLHDPVPDPGSVVVPSNGTAVGAPFWDAAAPAVLGVLLVLAVTGLVLALRHSWRPEPSRRSVPGVRA